MLPKTGLLLALPLVMPALMCGGLLWLSRGKTPRARALADRLGLHPADEMERIIQYRAVTIAYNVVLFALLGITLYSVFVKREAIPLSNLALLLGVLTQSVATLVLRHRAVAGDEEYPACPLWKTLLWIGGAAACLICLGGGLAFLVMAA